MPAAALNGSSIHLDHPCAHDPPLARIDFDDHKVPPIAVPILERGSASARNPRHDACMFAGMIGVNVTVQRQIYASASQLREMLISLVPARKRAVPNAD